MFFSLFFFSSRRRHTRCSRDWSSDVCSSDLDDLPAIYHDDGVANLLQRSQRAFGANGQQCHGARTILPEAEKKVAQDSRSVKQKAGRATRPTRRKQLRGNRPDQLFGFSLFSFAISMDETLIVSPSTVPFTVT